MIDGGIASAFTLAAGRPITTSLAKPDLVIDARAVMLAMKARGAEEPIAVDVVVAQESKVNVSTTVKPAAEVASGDMIFYVGLKASALVADALKVAGTIGRSGSVGLLAFIAFAEKHVGYFGTGSVFLDLLDGKTLPPFEILGRRATG